ncbi:ATP-binding cassette domain-containing protein [Dehalococcoidia bacterium]|nr:ATP-binding cassette domain-containing protein [Dehalococcoidia bacterium]
MIEVSNMSKYYADYPAVLDVSFSIKAGETVGLLGPNGAGKSTTMKVLTGFTPPTDGNVSIGGFDIIKNSFEARKLLGYLPENVPLYLDMTVTEYLVFMAKIRGMNESVNKRVNEVIEITSLGDYKDTLIGKLSKGYRQRTGISQAIIHNPKVLILDEPTIGIDPVQVVETRNLIKSLEGEHTLILSSHILPEVTSICKRILVIHEGKIVADDTPDNLSKRLQSTNVCEIEVSGSNKLDIIKLFRKESYIIDIRSKPSTNSSYNTFIIETSSNESVEQKIAKLVVENSLGLRKLIPLSLSLEEIFLQLTSD